MERELRLASMCWLTLSLSRAEGQYGLRLPGVTVAPDRGEGHRDDVLKALALFESDDTGSRSLTREKALA